MIATATAVFSPPLPPRAFSPHPNSVWIRNVQRTQFQPLLV